MFKSTYPSQTFNDALVVWFHRFTLFSDGQLAQFLSSSLQLFWESGFLFDWWCEVHNLFINGLKFLVIESVKDFCVGAGAEFISTPACQAQSSFMHFPIDSQQ